MTLINSHGKIPDLARVRDLLDYDPETGVFIWKRQIGSVVKGQVAGRSRVGKDYIRIKIDRVFYYAHRLAWLYVHGEYPDYDIDHKDGVKWNNKIDNLRVATRALNSANRRVIRNGLKGVQYINSKWMARIGHKGHLFYLGSFATEEEAHAAYLEAARRLYGEFARAA